jgi:hypothetical protein
MKSILRQTSIIILLITNSLFNNFLSAQIATKEYYLKGFYVQGSYFSFNKAMLMNWNDREVMLGQSKNMIAYGGGYAVLPKNLWAGFSIGANFSATNLDPFKISKITDPNMPSGSSPILDYKDISYSMLLFDFDGLIVPVKKLPFAFTLGFIMGGSFQGYTISGDDEIVLNANGTKSKSMFRYGFILGCKIIPVKFLSLDLEYRPMSAYSETTSYHDFLYSDGTWDYFGSSSTSSGPSERFFSVGISFHFGNRTKGMQ